MVEKKSKLEILQVIVERVRSTSERFSVFDARLADTIAPRLVVKMFTGPIALHQRWTVCGQYQEDPKWGKQFTASFATLAAPTSPAEFDTFLLSGLVDGWSYQHVADLRNHPGRSQICEIVEQRPHDLVGYAGIDADLLASLQSAWQRAGKLAGVYAQLADWGITGTLPDKIVKQYGFEAEEIVRTNPYAPIFDVERYGWKIAESIARQLAIDVRDPRRVQAGITVAVAEKTWSEGHTWLNATAAAAGATRDLELPMSEIRAKIAGAIDSGRLIEEEGRIYPSALYGAEETIAASVAQRLAGSLRGVAHDMSGRAQPDNALSNDQIGAVVMALCEPLSLLTGGPGCGKTTTIKEIVRQARAAGMPVTLMAPTGKAARRMTEATGDPASTIHSKLGLRPGEWHTDAELLTGMVVVDEVSMLDTQLTAAVMRGVSPRANLLLVGDPDQLPSVGPGAVLRDLIACEAIPRTHLTRVFRNDAGVAVNAARIRAGEMIISLPDCAIIRCETPANTADRILSFIERNRPQDCLILCGTHDGPVGRWSLNARLQGLLNMPNLETCIKQTTGEHVELLGPGDRVMLTRNDAEKGYSNGDVGRIVSTPGGKSLEIALDDGRQVRLSGESKRDCTLAYAITGHKSQGSEATTVIVAVAPSKVLSREWLYTAMTRGKRQVYLVGDPQAMQIAIDTVKTPDRRTSLVSRIEQMVSGEAPPAIAQVSSV